MEQKKPELLLPASSLEVLKTAVLYGADAVYIGGELFGLRANAHNFDRPQMEEAISYAHAHGVKVYVTVNIVAHNDDLAGVETYLNELKIGGKEEKDDDYESYSLDDDNNSSNSDNNDNFYQPSFFTIYLNSSKKYSDIFGTEDERHLFHEYTHFMLSPLSRQKI